MTKEPRSGGSTDWRSQRPEHFSTYAPRDLIRRLKVVAALRDVPLWAIVTDALERYLSSFEAKHGRLPQLTSSSRNGAKQASMAEQGE